MINSTNQLNEIVSNFSKENAISSINQLATIIDLCTKSGIKISVDGNYEESFAAFTSTNFPEWNAGIKNLKIESLSTQGKYEEAAMNRNELLSLKKDIHRRFRLENYGTEDWFIKKSENEILFLPTQIDVIDSLI